jgi:hypothetical protein
LINKTQHSNVVDAQSLTGADCDTDHYLVAAEVRQRLSVSKRVAPKFDVEGFNLKKVSDVDVK